MGDGNLPKNKIFIPTTGAPKVILNDMCEFKSVIGCKEDDGTSVSYLDHFGYRLSIFFDGRFLHKNLPINPLCSLLVKEKGPFYGNCIIMDDYKELTMEDLSKIIKIARVIPSLNWISEPSIQNYLNMKQENNIYYAFLKNKMETYIKNNPEKLRLTIWNTVKEYYVPPEDSESDDE
ncbi:Hypothetical protein HVR_LOCUS341 [uncultured virus]|nr:Hypothetical protein HVR_LOCUS341 [uncultured virus]